MGFFDFFKKKDEFDDLNLGLNSNTKINPQSNQNLLNQNVSSQDLGMQNTSLQQPIQSSASSDLTSTTFGSSLSQQSSSSNSLAPQTFQEAHMQQQDQFNNQMHNFQNSLVSNAVVESNNNQFQQFQDTHGLESNIELLKKDMQLIMEKLNTIKIMLDGLDARLRKLEQIAENEQKKPRYF